MSELSYPIFHWDIVQGTEEWKKLRSGSVTATVGKSFINAKGEFVKGQDEYGFGAGAITELYRVIEERLSGVPRANFTSTGANWGHEYEQEAREFFEMKHFRKVKEVGFVQKTDWIGASPDGLMPDIEEGLEIKCFPKEHMIIRETKIHGMQEYIQCQFNLWVTKYKAWNLLYYHPNLPESANHVEFRFLPDIGMHEKFDFKVNQFVKVVKDKLSKYQ